MATANEGGMAEALRGKGQLVLDAAAELFREQGYGGTSMDAVATRAGVSKATVYAHFATKAHLFAAVIRREAMKCFDLPAELAELPVRDGLTVIARRAMDLLLDPKVVATYRMVVAEAYRLPELAEAFFGAGPAFGLDRVGSYLAEQTRRGMLSVPDPPLAAELFINMLKVGPHSRLLWGLPPGGHTVDTVIAQAVDAMLATFAGTSRLTESSREWHGR